MKSFSKHNVFFIGIGGIGMSALARWFKAYGFAVVGYDKTATALTGKLAAEGMEIHFEDSVALIPEDFTKENTLVVYTPAIPSAHKQYNYFIGQNFELKKRAEVLGMISNSMFTVAVAGTHGKTTTSSMIAHILDSSGIEVTAFMGGIATNYNSNLILGQTEAAIAVIEADEYDRSFLQLKPNIEVITSVDADHLDIYGDKNEMEHTYKLFYDCLPEGGQCIISSKAQSTMKFTTARVYGRGESIAADNLRVEGHRYKFDYINGTQRITDIKLNLPGDHNADNAVAAITVATNLGVADYQIKDAFESYQGVKRRFEYILATEDFTFIDDYAHHPAEISAFLKTLKVLYPEKFVQVVFQPHLFSRTRDFADEFAKSLSLANSVVLMDIYPARELPIPGVTANIILDKIDSQDKAIMGTDEILSMLAARQPDVLATIGAGNIDALVPKIKELLTKSTAL